MKYNTDILSKIMFLVLLLIVLYLSTLGLIKKFTNYDYNGDMENIYVDIDSITIPNLNSEIINSSANIDFSEQNIAFPKLLNNVSYSYTIHELPINELSDKSVIYLADLQNSLTENLISSLEYSGNKNKDFATIQNIAKIQNFENDAREFLHSKISKNTPYKLKTYLFALGSGNHMDVLNTKVNRENASNAFSEYFLHRTAYMNDFYLYNINVERYRLQENKKTTEKIDAEFKEYETLQKELIDNKIKKSGTEINNIISNISISETSNKFSYENIENINTNISNFNSTTENITYKNNFSGQDKENIIINIGKENNYKVHFKKTNYPDKTKEIQKLIDNYGILYRM